jgi:universal stress protein E
MVKTEIKKILVAVKPRDRGLPLAAYHARFLAEGLNAELRVMSALHDSRAALSLFRDSTEAEAARKQLLEHEQQRLEELGQSLRDWGVTVSTRVRWQVPVHEAILEEVEEWGADLLVVGAHQPRALPHTVLIDTDWQLMRLCRCPLLLVKDPGFENYPSVLATVDPLHRHAEPSGLDRVVLQTAKQLSGAFGAELRVAHAFPDPKDFVYAPAVEVEPGEWYSAENIESLHRRALIELVSYYGVTEAQVDLLPGEPVEVITRLVEERAIKLVVLGAVKRGRLEQMLLGSTAEAVAAEVPCDVLLVKP